MMTCEAIRKYAATGRIRLNDDGSVMDGQGEADGGDAGARLWAMAENLAASTNRPVLQAFEQVRQTPEGRALLRAYNEQATRRALHNAGYDTVKSYAQDGGSRPDQQLHELAVKHMRDTNERDYGRAVSFVMRANSDLARSYARRSA